MEKREQGIDCFTCKHYYVTWDVQLPKGCRQYQFKSYYMPSQQVQRAIGAPCPGYAKKEI